MTDKFAGRPIRCTLQPAESGAMQVVVWRDAGCTAEDARDLCRWVLRAGVTALDGEPLEGDRGRCMVQMAVDGTVSVHRARGCTRPAAHALCTLAAWGGMAVIDRTTADGSWRGHSVTAALPQRRAG